MSGGIAYVLDEENALYRNINKEMITMEDVAQKADREEAAPADQRACGKDRVL